MYPWQEDLEKVWNEKIENIANELLKGTANCCSICLAKETKGLIQTSYCYHPIRETCLDSWVNNKCPLCGRNSPDVLSTKNFAELERLIDIPEKITNLQEKIFKSEAKEMLACDIGGKQAELDS